jgi:hypothetical protein
VLRGQVYGITTCCREAPNSAASSQHRWYSLILPVASSSILRDILDSTKDSGFEYIADEDKEFLIFNTNDFHADARSLYKIRKITGMRLAQISTHNCYTQIWFYRSTYPTSKNK